MKDPIILFLMSVIICSVLEYFTSYIMEKIFKNRWWDYSDMKYNINGRICLECAIPFGFGACFLMYIVNPLIQNIYIRININVWKIIIIILLVVLLLDILTVIPVGISVIESIAQLTCSLPL